MATLSPLTIRSALLLASSSLLLLYSPGRCLLAAAFPERPSTWAQQLLEAFLLSICILVITGTMALALNIRLGGYLGLITGTCALLLGIWAKRRASPGYQAAPEAEIAPANRGLLGLFLVVSLAVLVCFFLPIDRLFVTSDFWSYQGFVRKWTTWGPRPEGDLFVETAAVWSAYRYTYGGWLLAQALLSALSGVDSVDLAAWWLPSLLLTASYAVTYYAARILTRDRNAAMLAAMAYALCLFTSMANRSGNGRIAFYRINEDKFLLLFLLLPAAILLVTRYVRRNRRADLACAFTLLLAIPLIHPVGLVAEALVFGPFALVRTLLERSRKALLRLALLVVPLVFMLAIPLSQMALITQALSEPISELLQGRGPHYVEPSRIAAAIARGGYQDRILLLDNQRGIYVTHPEMIAHPVVLAALALTPLLLLYVRKSLAAQFLFSDMLGIMIVLYVPPITTLFGRLIPLWIIWRLAFLLPSGMVIGFMLGKLAEAAKERLRSRSPRLAAQAPLGSGALLLASAAVLASLGLATLPEVKRVTASDPRLDMLLAAREHVIEASTIMYERPDRLGVALPGMLQFGYVPSWHSTTLYPDTNQAIARFYASSRLDAGAWDILRRHNASFLLVSRERRSHLLEPTPLLTPLHQNSEYVLFRVADVGVDHPLIQANTFLTAGEWALAEEAFGRLSWDYPEQALLGVAMAADRQGKLDQAQSSYLQAVEESPQSVRAPLRLAEFLVRLGNYEAAASAYQQALQRIGQDQLLPDSIEDSLHQVAETGAPGLAAVPPSDRLRLGIYHPENLVLAQADLLSPGWTLSGDIHMVRNRQAEHIQVIQVAADARSPDWKVVDRALTRQRGDFWLVGLWPESPAAGGLDPEAYATSYRRIYDYIKARDLAATIVAGGIAQVSPARLAWLDAVMDAHDELYGEKLPADAWHINAFPLPERADDPLPGLPVGIETTQGAICGIEDQTDPEALLDQVVEFRRWMAKHSQAHKPLILSGMGPMASYEQLGDGNAEEGLALAIDYMQESSSLLRDVADPELGMPADGHHLVQLWLWGSPLQPAEAAGKLLDDSDELTRMGVAFAELAESWADSPQAPRSANGTRGR